jgi:DNA-binding beta-propeller fold protein YncE
MRILTLVCLISVVCLTSLTAYAASNKSASVITSRIAVSDTSFNHPHDLVLSPDGTNLYVSDLDNNVVKVMGPTTLKTIGTTGENDLDSPHDVSFDHQGRLMVADSGNDKIVVYEVLDNGGQKAITFGKGLTSPEGITPGPDGLIYATDTGGGTVIAYQKCYDRW